MHFTSEGAEKMIHELSFSKNDRIAVIAPHPDDECLGASAPLLLVPDQTDVFVLTDGSHGNRERPFEEEAEVRKKQFEAEMEWVKPHSYTWIGVEDTKMSLHPEAVRNIDFTPYSMIFLPWLESPHPDHRHAAAYCIEVIRSQKAKAACYSYEIFAPFHTPTHFADITMLAEKKRELIRFHEDQSEQEPIMMALNAFRGAQLFKHANVQYAETYLKIDLAQHPEAPDLLLKLYGIHDDPELFQNLTDQGIEIKRVMPMNISKVYQFIKNNFAASWADESLPSLIHGDCYVAVQNREILGFYAIETPAKNFLGPMGVIPSARSQGGIARALEITALKAMREKGYRYAVSGMVHPFGRQTEEMVCDLIPIPDSAGSYKDMI